MMHLTENRHVMRSSISVRPTRTDTGVGAGDHVSHLLSAGVLPLPFSLNFWDGDSLEVVLIGSGREPSWHWRVIDSIKRLAGLAPNWDSYGAAPLSATAVRRCIVSLLEAFPDETPEPTVVPTREGGLQLEWHRGEVDLEIEVPPTGPICYLLVDGTGEEREWEGAPSIHASAIENAIKRLMSIRTPRRICSVRQ